MSVVNLVFGGLTIPPAASLNRAAAGADVRQLAAAGARSLVPVVYGEDRVGALLLNVLPAGANSPTLLAQCLWSLEASTVSDILLNDQPLPGGSTVTTYTGSQLAVDAAMAAAFAAQGVAYGDTLAGFAYSVIAMPVRAYAGGPLNFTAKVRGRLLYDPRFDAAAPFNNTTTAVPGTPGAPPTGWALTAGSGIASQIVGAGIEDGLPYVDVRWFGTAAVSTFATLRVIPSNSVPATPGQQWRAAAFVRLMAGSAAGAAGVYTSVNAAAGATFIGGLASAIAAPTSARLRTQRKVTGAYTVPAGANNVFQSLQVQVLAGSSIDLTLRWGLPMLWNVADVADPLSAVDVPALALADFLSNERYGAGIIVDWVGVRPAAAANDTPVGVPGERRRTLNLALTQAAPVADWADTLRAYAGCWIVAGANGLRLLPDEDGPAVATYAHESGQIASIEPLVLRDIGNAPTVIDVVYTDTTSVPWRDAVASASLPGAGTTLPYRVSTVRMPGIQRHSQANREAVERLNKLTVLDLSTSVEVFDEGIRHDLGDIITLAHPVGLVNQAMRVTNVQMAGPGRWLLQVAEHDSSAYSSAVVAYTSPLTPGRIVPPGPPPDVADLAVEVIPGGLRLKWSPWVSASWVDTEIHDEAVWSDESPSVWRGKASTAELLWIAQGPHTYLLKHRGDQGERSANAASLLVFVEADGRVSLGQAGWRTGGGAPASWGDGAVWGAYLPGNVLIGTRQVEAAATTKVYTAAADGPVSYSTVI